MKISILMPTYGCPEELMEKSILSVARQSHADFELVIKDGNIENPAINSTRIANLIRSLGDKVKYINSPDGPPADESGFFRHNGFYEALNMCVQESSGDVLSLLCSDDERGDDSTLEYVNDVFERHGTPPFFLYGQCEWVDKNSNHLEYKQPPTTPITFESLLRDYTLYTPSLYWNKAVHEKFGFFNTDYAWCADLDFWLRCWRGMESRFAPRVLGKYRVWGTSQARSNEPLLGQQSLAIQAMHRRAL